MNKWQKITAIFIAVTTALIIGYDILALIKGGNMATISTVLGAGAMKYPVIAFAWGFLSGHLFWPNKDANVDGK